MNKDSTFWSIFGSGIFLAPVTIVCALNLGIMTYRFCDANKIPYVEPTKVEPNYVQPNELEIKCKDLNGNGLKETLLMYKGKQYLLVDENGKPIIKNYTIKSVEIIPEGK